MRFYYKGIDSEYKYKRGSIDADSEVEAIKKIKEDEDIIVIMNINKVSNFKSLNRLRDSLNVLLVNVENKINQRTKAIVQRGSKKSNPALKKDKNKETKVDIKTKSIGTNLAEKSPILKGLNNLASRFSSKPTGSNRQVIMDEELYENLQNMFRDNMESSSMNMAGSDDYDFEVSNSELADSKVEKSQKKVSREKAAEKEIDWSLLDNDDNPDVKNNMKIKVKSKEIIMFTRRLHIMLSSGVPLLNSLMSLQKTSSKNMSLVLDGVVHDIQSGNSFSEAIAKYPRQFDYNYVALISIGETSGSLEKSLDDLIESMEREQKISRKIKIASIYPAAVGVVLVALIILAYFFMIPQFTAMFPEDEGAMPRFTVIVFGIANKVPLILLVIAIVVLIFTFLRKRIPELNYLYRSYVDKLFLKLPVLRNVNNASYMFSFSSTIALMLDNGIRLSHTLGLTQRTINNIYIKNEIENVSNLMLHGFTFSEALGQQEHFDEILVNITLTGEESGQMIFALTQVASYFETELIRQIDALMELVQPVSILLIASIVAPVVIAAFLPILELSSGAGIF